MYNKKKKKKKEKYRNITIYRDECSIRVADCSIRIFRSFVIIILASPRLLPTAVQHY